ncbi:alanine/glycine:cation symporter family protein [Agaribacterium haliotis]|uniref:alanine/glycine:cation symporter family protein n=1 Tax=Agaribacterium haliotis TaxID=2013869 RepID=UPI001EFDDEC5|nr:alanine/glycine:cation symporter family protein [Agaribacterium haliotis]
MSYFIRIALIVGASLFFSGAAHAEQSFSECMKIEGQGLDYCADQAVAPVSNWIASKVFYEIPIGDDIKIRWIVIWLIFGALFFTFYLRFVSIWGFKHAIDLVRGKYADPHSPGEVSHFQALTTALSGTVGLGNIAGVAVAISLGGPGATFWMILAGLLGMSSKFAECTLGVKYRMYHSDGSVSGGPKYYLTTGLAERGLPNVGKVLAFFFAICCIGGAIGAGNMFQSNQAFAMTLQATGGDASPLAGKGWLFGLVIAILVAFVIIGGIRSIARVTARLVPLMASIYVLTALVILLSNFSQIPDAFGLIIKGAFAPEGVVGGFIGAMIQGFQRAGFSNEAGFGSAAIAHSAVKTKEPATEGFVALLEPFIDTVVICTMTALVIIITGSLNSSAELSGVALTASAFSSVFPWFEVVLAIAVVLFAISTMLSWSYYGSISWGFLFGHSKVAKYSFKVLFCLFIVLGAMASLGNVITFSDSMVFLMSLFNIAGLYLLAPVIRQEVQSYKQRMGQAGSD